MKDLSGKKEVLNVTLTVTEEIYKNPDFTEPTKEAKQEGLHSIDMMEEYQPEYLKKSHFEIKGTLDGMDIRRFASRIIHAGRGMGMAL